MLKIRYFTPLFCLLLFGGLAFAQTESPTATAIAPATTPATATPTPPPEITQMIQADENINPQDLGVGNPRILPDSPLYAFKNIGRGFQSFFVRDPVKKAELKLKFTNEKIVEAQKLAEKTDNPDTLNKALDNYKTETDRLKIEVEKIKGNAEDNPNVDKFLDKFIDQNIKQQKLIGKLEKDLPSAVSDKIKSIKEENLAKFSDITLQIAPPEILQEKLTKSLEMQIGSQFKNFKNLEVLKEIEEKVPEPAKDAMKKAQENTFKRLQDGMEKMAPEDREKFGDYIKNSGGNEVKHMEIIHEFETREMPTIVREEIEKAKERVFERIDKKMRELGTDKQKEEFLQPLGGGQMEDLRILNELENNLSPETIDKILEIKNQAMKNFRDELEKADTPQLQEEFSRNLEQFHDVKQFEIFKEMDNIIPEDKKEFWGEMKEKVKEEMKKDVNRAINMEERQLQFERLAGDAPEHIEILKEFGAPPEIMKGIMNEQVKNLGQRIQNIEDPARLQFLKQGMEEEGTVKKELENRNPEIFQKIEQRQTAFFEEITKEMASAQIEKAKQEIVAAENEFSGLDDKTKNEVTERSPYRVLLTNAQKKINIAQSALENELYGESFGMATAAFQEANNARRIIKEIGLRRQMFEKQETERKTFEENFFQESGEKKEEFEKQFKEQFPTENIPLPGEFRAEFLPPEEVLIGQPMPPYPAQPGQPGGEAPKPPIEGCACIQVWDPVCGADGRTYGNACEAKCANIEIKSKGSCGEKPGLRPSVMLPMECASDLSCPQPKCVEGTQCPRFKCLNGKCISEATTMQEPKELPCAKEGQEVNRNPLLGPTNQRCCPNLQEIRVSKSYSICQKEIKREGGEMPTLERIERMEGQPPMGLPTPAATYKEDGERPLSPPTAIITAKCGWCGAACTEFPLKEGTACPQMAPAPGYQCVEENGKCVTKYTRGEEKREAGQEFKFPQQQPTEQEGPKMPQPPEKQGESPFQFFKETISNILKPEQRGGGIQPMQPSPMPGQQMPLQPMPGTQIQIKCDGICDDFERNNPSSLCYQSDCLR